MQLHWCRFRANFTDSLVILRPFWSRLMKSAPPFFKASNKLGLSKSNWENELNDSSCYSELKQLTIVVSVDVVAHVLLKIINNNLKVGRGDILMPPWQSSFIFFIESNRWIPLDQSRLDSKRNSKTILFNKVRVEYELNRASVIHSLGKKWVELRNSRATAQR